MVDKWCKKGRTHAYLPGKHRVEKSRDVGGVDSQLETHDLTGGVYAFVRPCTPLELC